MAKQGKVSLAPVPSLTLTDVNAPTPERLKQAGVTVKVTLGGRTQILGPKENRPIGADGVFRMTEAPLDRLASRRRLDERRPDHNQQLYEAGQRLRRLHYVGGLVGIGSNDLNRSGAGKRQPAIPFTQAQAEARDELDYARRAMHPHDWTVVFQVVCEERSLEDVGRGLGYRHTHAATAVALDRLRRGLDVAGELFGYVPPRHPAVAA